MNEEQMALLVERIARMFVKMFNEMEEAKKPRYISRRECAEMLGVTLPTIHNYVNQGKLTPHYFNGSSKPRFEMGEIERGLQSGELGKYTHNKKGGAI